MRPRRTLLSSLAPLIGLSALMAVIAAEPASPKQPRAQHPLVRLIHSVFQFVAPSAETPSSRSHAHGLPPRVLFAPSSAFTWTLAPAAVVSPILRRKRLLSLRI
jgi:hypothetical protein